MMKKSIPTTQRKASTLLFLALIPGTSFGLVATHTPKTKAATASAKSNGFSSSSMRIHASLASLKALPITEDWISPASGIVTSTPSPSSSSLSSHVLSLLSTFFVLPEPSSILEISTATIGTIHNAVDTKEMIVPHPGGDLLSSSSMTLSSAASTLVAAVIQADPNVESEILTDLSHLALDFTTIFFAGRSSAFVKLAEVVGRVLVMSADYVPDHSLWPEEWVFQSVMLVVALVGLWKQAVNPMIFLASSSANEKNPALVATSFADRRVYARLWKPMGVTWIQFVSLLRSGVLDWTTVESHNSLSLVDADSSGVTTGVQAANHRDCSYPRPAGGLSTTKSNQGCDSPRSLDNGSGGGGSPSQHEHDEGRYMYWLYKGDVKIVSSEGQVLQTLSSSSPSSTKSTSPGGGRGRLQESSSSSPPSVGMSSSSASSSSLSLLLEEDHFVRQILKEELHRDMTSNMKDAAKKEIRAGPLGATLLRIDTIKLQQLMSRDASLTNSIRRLVMSSLHHKLQAALTTIHTVETTSAATTTAAAGKGAE